MTTNPIFRGVATAIITPTNANGVDYEAFGRLIDWQIDEGINAIVVCGTTGENPTLTDAEHKECIRFCVERVNHRVPVIAGTGSNDTAHAIEMTKYACSVGADAILVVTPYYNKATQKGLVAMFNAIADASTVPMIVYNVPSRTGVSIEPATYVELAKHPRIAAIKEANGNISKIVKTARCSATRWTSTPATTTRSCRSCPWAASASSPFCPTSRRARPWRSATAGSAATCRALPRCSWSCCRSSTRCSARSTPSPSRPPWPPWAGARTSCACRSRR